MEKEGRGGPRPKPLVQIGLRLGAGRATSWLLPLLPTKAHEGAILLPRIPVTTRYSEKYPNHSKPFRCPNIVVQYNDLYISTILRLLVMSAISSGTPNYLQYIKSHNS